MKSLDILAERIFEKAHIFLGRDYPRNGFVDSLPVDLLIVDGINDRLSAVFVSLAFHEKIYAAVDR